MDEKMDAKMQVEYIPLQGEIKSKIEYEKAKEAFKAAFAPEAELPDHTHWEIEFLMQKYAEGQIKRLL